MFQPTARLLSIQKEHGYSDDGLPMDRLRATAIAGHLAKLAQGSVARVLGSAREGSGIVAIMKINDARVLEVARDPRVFLIEPHRLWTLTD
jgi:hypothetical protein